MDTVIVIMQKDKETGFLDKELASLTINENESFIVNLFVMENDNNEPEMHLKLSTEKDVDDWEFSAIFDYYDTDIYSENVKEVLEIDDTYNPTWEFIFDYSNEINEIEEKIIKILSMHKTELEDVYETIKDKESEYNEKK